MADTEEETIDEIKVKLRQLIDKLPQSSTSSRVIQEHSSAGAATEYFQRSFSLITEGMRNGGLAKIAANNQETAEAFGALLAGVTFLKDFEKVFTDAPPGTDDAAILASLDALGDWQQVVGSLATTADILLARLNGTTPKTPEELKIIIETLQAGYVQQLSELAENVIPTVPSTLPDVAPP